MSLFKRKPKKVEESKVVIDPKNPFNDEYPELSYCRDAKCECTDCEKHPSKMSKQLPVMVHDYRNTVFCVKD